MRVAHPLLCLVLLAGFAIPMSATAAGPQDRADLLIRGAAVISMGGPGAPAGSTGGRPPGGAG